MLNHKIKRNINRLQHKPDRPFLLRVLLLTLLTLPLTVTAGVYKWVDEEGKVHYGSQRPENLQAEKMKVDTGKTPPYQPSSPVEKKAAGTAEAEKKEAAAEPAKAREPEPPKEPVLSRKEKKRLCDAARQRVASIESRGRLKAVDDKGNMRHLTDSERSGRLNQARADVSKYCR